MSITLIDYLTFPFNDGKGLRTDQLEGPYNQEQLRALGLEPLSAFSLRWLRHKSWWTGDDETERFLAVAYDNDAPWAFVRTKTGNLLILSDGSRRELAGAAFDPNGVAIVEDHAYTLKGQELSIWDGSDKRILHVGVSGAHLYRLPVAAETDQWLGIDASATKFFALRANEAGDDLDLAVSDVTEITRPPFTGSDQLARLLITAAAATAKLWDSAVSTSAATGDLRVYEAAQGIIDLGSLDIENSHHLADNGGELVRMEIKSGITGGDELALNNFVGSFTGDNAITSSLGIGTVRITNQGSNVDLVIRRTAASTTGFNTWVDSVQDDGGAGKSFYLIDAAGNVAEFLISTRSDAKTGFINWIGYLSDVRSQNLGEAFTLIVARSGGLTPHTFVRLGRAPASTAVWSDWDKQRYSLYYVSPDPANVVQEILFEDVDLETDDILEWRISGAASPDRPAPNAVFRLIVAERGGLSLISESATVLSDPTLLTVPMTDPPSGLPVAMSVRNDKLAVLFTGGGVGVWDVAANAITRASGEDINFNQHVSADTPASLIFDGLPLIYHTSDYVRQWKEPLTPVSMDVAAALPAAADQPRTRLTAIGEDAATGLLESPYYRHIASPFLSLLRADYLGAGRIGYCVASLGDTVQGPAISAGGSINPEIPNLLTLAQEDIPFSKKVQIILESTDVGTLGTETDPISLKIAPHGDRANLITVVLTEITGQPTGRKRWEAELATSLLDANVIYEFGIFVTRAAVRGLLTLHAGDYLEQITDKTIGNFAAADLGRRALIDARQRGRVRSIIGSPDFHEDNYLDLQLDHSAGRAWIGERRPVGATPSTASSTAWAPGAPNGDNFRGSRTSEPSTADTDRYDIYYDIGRDQWRTRTDSYGSVVFWEARGFGFAIKSSKILGTFHWLGARADANEAANHVGSSINLNDFYLFYSRADRRIDVITASTWALGGTRLYQYEPHYLVTQPDLATALIKLSTGLFKPEVLSEMPLAGFEVNNAHNQAHWPQDQKQKFKRILVEDDDDRLISMEIRWRERKSTSPNSTQFIDRSASITLQAGMFRHFEDRRNWNYVDQITATAAGKTYIANSAVSSADIFVRKPDYQYSRIDESGEMKISYGRYHIDANPSASILLEDGIMFSFGRKVGSQSAINNTLIQEFRCRILLHV